MVLFLYVCFDFVKVPRRDPYLHASTRKYNYTQSEGISGNLSQTSFPSFPHPNSNSLL